MPTAFRFLFVTVFLYLVTLLAPYRASAQTPTGTPPFGSFAGGSFDTVDLANLNVYFGIPILGKAGRGLPFHYAMNYNSSIWVPTAPGSSYIWKPVNTSWGWTALSEALTGSVPVRQSTLSCFVTNPDSGLRTKVPYPVTFYDGYKDANGTFHPASIMTTPGYADCDSGPIPPVYSGSQAAVDGSGYLLTVNEQASPSIVVYNRGGWSIPSPGTSTGMVIDTNGNELTTAVNGTTTTFTDTLGTTVLTITSPTSAATTYSYTAPSGAQAQIVFNYTQETVQTNFACSGVSEYPATQVYLVTSVTLPDSSSYTFNYETAPGDSHSPHYVTGRLASLTLPTGGTISYAYSGGSNGINCSDGSAPALARTTPDGTWNYSQGAGTTTITDPAANVTTVYFKGIYEIERMIYQGPALSANLLKTVEICYNGTGSLCNPNGVTLPITQRTVTEILPGSSNLQCKHIYNYNSNGLPTEQDDYDYGSGAPPASPLRKTLITYASLANNILDHPATVKVQDGSGNSQSQTNYNYDETGVVATSGTPQHVSVSGSRGNLTSVNSYTNASTYLTSRFTYFDTGNVQTATDLNGSAQTTYTYGACGNSFPTSISEPLSMSRSVTWDCTGRVPLTATDENGKTITDTYNDPYFWRKNATADQLGNTTSFYYQPNPTYCCPWAVAATLSFNNGNSIMEDLQYKDGLGRTYVDQHPQGPGSSTLDSVSYTFDANGRPHSESMPCAISYAQTCPTAAWTQTYDALNRPLQTADGGGGYISYSYSQNDVLVTIGPAPSGENAKQRQLEYDALGRLTSVCEITSAAGSGTCSQNSAQTGYWTKHVYDPLGNLTGVTQNAQATGSQQQTRAYSYDFLSRLTSETNAENGATTYTYDSDLTCGNSSGDRVKRVDAAGNTKCSAYDILHRVTSITYPSGPNISSTPMKVFYYDTSHFNATSNTLGRLASVGTCQNPTCAGPWITAEDFSYSARGELTDVYEWTANSGGWYHVAQSYWANGAPSQLSGSIGLPTVSYGVDGEGRTSAVSASSGQNPVTGVTFNAGSRPTQVNFGSGDTDIFAYDSNTLRMTQFKFNVGAQPQTYIGALTWNANSTLGQLAITDPFNSADTQTCTYAHDDLTRIAGANCGAAAAQTFSYDPFGNINKSGSPYSFQPAYSAATNRMTSLPGFTPTYDANGNLLNDNSHAYTWDADGNSVTVDGIGLTYDALDRMVEQNRSGSYTQIVYAPTGGKLALMSGQSLVKAFIPLPGQATAVYTSSGLDHYRHSDWLGSARLTSSPSQAYLSSVAYAPFGETYAQSGSADLSFTGQNSDTVSGDYDFLFREYSMQGRWASPDPAGLAAVNPANPQSWNRYAYVLNDAVDLLDPIGLTVCDATGNNCYDSVTVTAGGGGGGGTGLSGGGTDDPGSLILMGGRGAGNPYLVEISRQLAPLNKLSDCTGQAIADEVPFGRQLLGAPSSDYPGKGSRFLARATSGNPQGNLIRLPATDAPGFIPWNYSTNVQRISQGLDAVGLPELADVAASIGRKLGGFASKFSKLAGAVGALWTAGNVVHNTTTCYNKN